MQIIKELEELLDKAKSIVVKKQETSFLDVINSNSDENIISDILSFLFNNNEHGFRDLWLKSLLECYSINSNKEISFDDIEVEHIKREKSTSERKRIDLFIDTSKYLILVENKIYAGAYNPFDSYHNDAKENKDEKEIIEILLSIYEEKNFNQGGSEFVNITYQQLINQVKKNIGDYVFDANDKWFIYIKDFIFNMEKIIGGTNMSINKEWNKLLKEKKDEVKDFLDNFNNDFNSKMDLLNSIIKKVNNFARDDDIKGPIANPYNIRKNFNYTYGTTHSSCYINITVGVYTLVIEPFFMGKPNNEFQLNILYIALWNRREKNPANVESHFDFTNILSYIDKEMAKKGLGIVKKSEKKGTVWGNYYVLKEIDLSGDFDLDEVSRWIYMLYQIIVDYSKHS